MYKITNFMSVIQEFEINSSYIFKNVKVLYKNDISYNGNIHFDNKYLEDYLLNKNYPIIKIKKILGNYYFDNVFSWKYRC